MSGQITDAMKQAAHDFESAAIDAGMDFAKAVYESQLWGGVESGVTIFAIDKDNRTHIWKGGD